MAMATDDSCKELDKTLSEIIRRLKETLDIDKVILFGSYAMGRADKDSDLDLLIIAPSEDRPLERRLKVRELLKDIDRSIGLDILFYTPEEVSVFEHEPSSFLYGLLKEGVAVYESQRSFITCR